MNYQLQAGEPATSTSPEKLHQEIAVLDSYVPYDPNTPFNEAEPWPGHQEAVDQLTGPLNANGEMQDGWTREPEAISGYWLWTIYGYRWILMMPWIRIRP